MLANSKTRKNKGQPQQPGALRAADGALRL